MTKVRHAHLCCDGRPSDALLGGGGPFGRFELRDRDGARDELLLLLPLLLLLLPVDLRTEATGREGAGRGGEEVLTRSKLACCARRFKKITWVTMSSARET